MQMTNREIALAIPTPPVGFVPPILEHTEDINISTLHGALTEGEVSMILKDTLLPEHHRSQQVITFIAVYMRSRSTKQASEAARIPTVTGMALRNRPDVHAAITRLTEKSVNKFGFDASEVVERVKEISSMDPIELENPDGSFKKMSEIPAEARRAIKKLKVKNIYGVDPNGMPQKIGEIIEYEMHDKLKAHELLGREKDLFKEKKTVEHDITKDMASVLLDSSRRANDHKNRIIDVTPVRTALPSPPTQGEKL